MTKRIEYIDALRGFTMMLVVSVHIYSMCFMQGNVHEYDLSYNNFFGLFRMPLFFFISGFVFYKSNRIWDITSLKEFITSKVRVQILSTLVFFFIFCLLFRREIKVSLFDSQKLGYWFTYILFIYFVLYIIIDKTISVLCRQKAFSNYTFIASFIVGLLLYFFINNGLLLNILSPQATLLLSISKWQYFAFFSFGCFTHKYYDIFLKSGNNTYIKGCILILFVFFSFLFFYQNITHIIISNYILRFFSATFGILLILFVFKKHESSLSSSTKLGITLQYIGKHTLDIYFLHYFFLPYNLSFIGKLFLETPNPLLEFCLSIILALIVIVFCLAVSKIIRISSTLTFLLLGGK